MLAVNCKSNTSCIIRTKSVCLKTYDDFKLLLLTYTLVLPKKGSKNKIELYNSDHDRQKYYYSAKESQPLQLYDNN